MFINSMRRFLRDNEVLSLKAGGESWPHGAWQWATEVEKARPLKQPCSGRALGGDWVMGVLTSNGFVDYWEVVPSWRKQDLGGKGVISPEPFPFLSPVSVPLATMV